MLRPYLKRLLVPTLAKLIDRLPGTEIEALLADRARRLGRPLFYPEYPFESRPRWTPSNPHQPILQLLASGEERYKKLLLSFNEWKEALRQILVRVAGQEESPVWVNGWLPALDSLAIYGLLRGLRPTPISK